MNSNINKPKIENSAGIRSLKYADIVNVESVENGVLKMKPGFTLKSIQNSLGKWNFDSNYAPEANGEYDFKLSGTISGHDKALSDNSVLAACTGFVLVIELDNITYLAGNPDEGIHCKFGHYSGTMPGDDTGYKLEFYRKLRRPAMMLNSII